MYKRQGLSYSYNGHTVDFKFKAEPFNKLYSVNPFSDLNNCLLYTSDAADERSSVDLGGRRIIKKKKKRVITVLRHTKPT